MSIRFLGVLLSGLLFTWMSFRFRMTLSYLFRRTFLRVLNLLFRMFTTRFFVTHRVNLSSLRKNACSPI
jgi:hypothetical protein